MTSFESNPIDALAGLLVERRRYEGWLAQLESRREVAPSHVVDRVRIDYLSRLDGVTQQLRGRATELELSATGLRERIGALLLQETTRRDERAELELRALVGELDPERAHDSIGACDSDLQRLGAERGALEAEHSRVAEVLALVTPPPAPEPDPEPAVIVNRVAVEEASDGRPTQPTLLTQEMAGASALETSNLVAAEPSPIDELAFLQSVVDAPREAGVPATLGEAATSLDARQDHGADLLPPPVLSAPRRPVTPLSSGIPTSRDTFGNPAKTSTLTPGSMPAFLKDMPTEQVKTDRKSVV